MKKFTYLLTLAILPQLVSCGGDNSRNLDALAEQAAESIKEELSLDDAESMTFAEASTISWEERKPVTIEGYFQLPFSASITSAGQSSYLFGRRNQTHGNSIYTYIPLGNGENEMAELKNGFLAKDFKLKDNGGVTVGINERVKVTGLLYSIKSYTEGEPNTVYFELKKVEKVDEKDADYESLDFPELTKEIADNKSDHKGNPYVLEGKIEVPMFVLTGEEMSIDLIDNAGDKFSLKVITGTGKNQMENLSSNWTPNDIKIRDHEGNLLSVGANVRVYGVLALDGLHVEYIEAL